MLVSRAVTETIKILCLAVVQGLTEFLPVSSSGHLVLAQRFLGVQSPGPDLELFLHVGTLLSVCLFYRRRLASLLADLARGRRAGVLYAAWVLVSMVPAGVAYATGRDFFDRIYDSPRTVAALLVANGVLLLLSALPERRSRAERPLDGLRALAMGVGQAIAVLPGISRSGTSISAGRLFGLARSSPARRCWSWPRPGASGRRWTARRSPASPSRSARRSPPPPSRARSATPRCAPSSASSTAAPSGRSAPTASPSARSRGPSRSAR